MIMILIMMAKPRMSRIWIALLVAALLLGACSSDDGSEGLTLVATTSIWGDVLSQIVGDDAEVEVLVPRGADAHDYQPSPQQVARLTQADLVVANGLGLEEGLADVLTSARSDGVNVLEVAPQLDPLPFSAQGEDGGLDPHVWFDPQRVASGAEMIATELSDLDDSVDWISRARVYGDDLATADQKITQILATIPDQDRKLVTNHDAFGYLASRYGFEIVGVVIPGGSTLSDPSSAELADLVGVIRDEEVPAIFAESTQPIALAQAVATEAGRDVDVVELYSGSLGDPPADTLIGMITEDARRIAGALS